MSTQVTANNSTLCVNALAGFVGRQRDYYFKKIDETAVRLQDVLHIGTSSLSGEKERLVIVAEADGGHLWTCWITDQPALSIRWLQEEDVFYHLGSLRKTLGALREILDSGGKMDLPITIDLSS